MRETEILRGLSKAREGCYAAGAVPETKRPSIASRMVGRLTGGMLGTAPPKKVEPIAVEAVKNSTGGIGNAARSLSGRQKQLDEAMAYKDGMTPYVDGAGVVHGKGTPTSDNISVRVSPDEAILPAKTVDAIGADNLASIIADTNGKMPSRGLKQARPYATGYVDPLAKANSFADVTKAKAVQAQNFATANATKAVPPTPPAPTFGQRVVQNIPGRGAANAAGSISKTLGKASLGLAKKAFVPAALASELNEVGGTLLDPNKSTGTKIQSGVESGLKLAAGAIGSGVGGAVGTAAGPVGTVAGGIGGGVAGYKAADTLIDGARNVFGLSDPNEGSRSILEMSRGQPAGGTTVPTPVQPQPVPNTAQTGSIPSSMPTQPTQQPLAPVARPTQQNLTQANARSLQNAIRSGNSPAVERGTGYIVRTDGSGSTTDPETGRTISNSGNGAASGAFIDTRQQAQSGQPSAPEQPFDQVRSLLSDAAKADATGTLQGQITSSNLRRQAEALGKVAQDEQAIDVAREGNGLRRDLADMFRGEANSRAERTADQQAADSFAKRLNERFPDTVDADGNKVDNGPRRAEVQKLLAATLAKLPQEEQDKLFNPATGATRGIEGLDPKTTERLLFNLDVRDRVKEAGSGFLNGLAGNQGGQLSDNLLDYDLENAVQQGDMLVFPNGARINVSDVQYDEGAANPLIPDSLFKTPTSRFTSRLRQGQK
jgi:hypothetical protein